MIRIVGRLKKLNQMVIAITATIRPMINALVLLFITTSIFAVLAAGMCVAVRPAVNGSKPPALAGQRRPPRSAGERGACRAGTRA